MLVGITELVLNYENKMFSQVLGENIQVYSMLTNTVNFALTKQEQKRAESITVKLVEHLIMVKWSEDDKSIAKNKSDIVTKFLAPIYTLCLKNKVTVGAVIYSRDDDTLIKLVEKNLRKLHNYKRELNSEEILKMVSKLIYICDNFRLNKTPWSKELGYEILNELGL